MTSSLPTPPPYFRVDLYRTHGSKRHFHVAYYFDTSDEAMVSARALTRQHKITGHAVRVQHVANHQEETIFSTL